MAVGLSETRLQVETKCSECPAMIAPGARAFRRMSRRDGYPLLCPRCATGAPQAAEEGKAGVRIDHAQDGSVFACLHCGAAIYYANKAWRHADTKRAERFDLRPCPTCGGRGEVEMGRRTQRCLKCRGLKTIQVVNHEAEPTEDSSADPFTSARLTPILIGKKKEVP